MRFLSSAVLASLLCATAPAADVIGDSQWIEEAGGTVTRNAAGKVVGVDLRSSWVSDTDLRKLLQYPELTHLNLSLTRISDQGMQEIRSLKNVEDLDLTWAEYVTDEGLAAIKDWRKLKRLNVHGTKISDTTLDHIAGISSIETLNIGSAMITDVGLERLAVLPNLKELTMGGNELGDAGLQALRQLPGLTYLDLSGRQGTDSNVWAISMSEVGLEAVISLKNLRELRFGCTSIGVGIEGAKFATVSAMSVNDRWLEQTKSMTKLEKIKLQGCDRVDDEGAKILGSMPALREIDLKGSAVTEKGLAALRAAKPKAIIYHGPWDAKAANFRNN